MGFATLASSVLALMIAAFFGPLLGRLATQWFTGRGFSNLLTEIRGAFLPFLLAAIVAEKTTWDIWVVVGTVVGFSQAIAVGRWTARRSGAWSPSLLGGIALGRSRAALLSAQATARGAVVGTLSLTLFQVVLLEALLSALEVPGVNPRGSIGAALLAGNVTDVAFSIAIGAGTVLATEALASWLFQRRADTTSP
jgi:hypothetical protein